MSFLAVFRIFILTSGLVVLVGTSAKAQHSEIERLKGFAEHQLEEKQFEKERLKGEKEFNEELETWERKKQQDLADYRKSQAKKIREDKGQDYKEDVKERQAWRDEYEVTRKAYAKDRKKFDRKNYKDLVPEEDELGLISNRPRYALKSRGIYGAPSKLGKLGIGGSLSAGTSSSSGSGATSSGMSPSIPSPPPFDDFGDGGFVPAAGMGESFGDDIPPPPPPPPMPFDSGFDGIQPNASPPAPNFDEGFGGF